MGRAVGHVPCCALCCVRYAVPCMGTMLLILCHGMGGSPVGARSPQSALGSCLTYFRHPFLRRKFFVDPNLREFFAAVFATWEFGNPTGAWQAGRDRQAHGADSRLVSSRSTSKRDEKRSPGDPSLLQDVSASLAGLGVRSRVFSRHRDPALREDDEQLKPSRRRKAAMMVAIQTQRFVA